eukprot:1077622-Pleurochrysis_carterae.AAC.2
MVLAPRMRLALILLRGGVACAVLLCCHALQLYSVRRRTLLCLGAALHSTLHVHKRSPSPNCISRSHLRAFALQDTSGMGCARRSNQTLMAYVRGARPYDRRIALNP